MNASHYTVLASREETKKAKTGKKKDSYLQEEEEKPGTPL
jgi:hypothetical protein